MAHKSFSPPSAFLRNHPWSSLNVLGPAVRVCPFHIAPSPSSTISVITLMMNGNNNTNSSYYEYTNIKSYVQYSCVCVIFHYNIQIYNIILLDKNNFNQFFCAEAQWCFLVRTMARGQKLRRHLSLDGRIALTQTGFV